MFLPDDMYMKLMRYEHYGILVLLLLSWLGVTGGFINKAILGVYGALLGVFY
jgi:hypothetical protein